MNPTTGELLKSGLIITALGMGLVFASLALLWALLKLLGTVLKDAAEPVQKAPGAIAEGAEAATVAESRQAALDAEAALTAERAHVAAVVAGALLSNALPLLFEAPSGPAFEHGRVAPSWVTGNRARALHSWQPVRVIERPHDFGAD
mgnify:CR=1 FL=1